MECGTSTFASGSEGAGMVDHDDTFVWRCCFHPDPPFSATHYVARYINNGFEWTGNAELVCCFSCWCHSCCRRRHASPSHHIAHSFSFDRKLVTAVLTAGVAVHSTLYTDYQMPPHLQGEKHVFSDLQVWYKGWIDKHVWSLPPRPPPTPQQQSNDKAQQDKGINQ